MNLNFNFFQAFLSIMIFVYSLIINILIYFPNKK